jgi:glycosyltransferase involved in cell wall biosynthesis
VKNKFIIIAPNIKTGGGKELLEYLIEYIEVNYKNIFLTVYLDSSLNHIKNTLNRSVIYMNSSIAKIKLFNKKIDNAIYFGNLPPLKKSTNSIVYFHNPYLLMDMSELKNSSFKFFIKYILQQMYIKMYIKNVDRVACQNENMKKAFVNKYNFKNVKILPFFRLCNKLEIINTVKVYDFCYVSLAHPHKNHTKLLDAIEIIVAKNIKINIALTIEDGHCSLEERIKNINKKNVVKITNLGLLPKSDVCKLYTQSKALVFPSTQETFGLALIEAVEMGLDVIASDLEYVYESITPTLVFNQNDASDIANKLIKYLDTKDKQVKSKSKIKNKIEDLIKIILKGEKNVQK